MELVEMQAMPSDKDMSEKDADLLKNTGVKKKGELFRFCCDSEEPRAFEGIDGGRGGAEARLPAMRGLHHRSLLVHDLTLLSYG